MGYNPPRFAVKFFEFGNGSSPFPPLPFVQVRLLPFCAFGGQTLVSWRLIFTFSVRS